MAVEEGREVQSATKVHKYGFGWSVVASSFTAGSSCTPVCSEPRVSDISGPQIYSTGVVIAPQVFKGIIDSLIHLQQTPDTHKNHCIAALISWE